MNEMIVIDLPKLQSIELGWGVLFGSYSESCSLIMRSMNEIECNNWI